MSKNYQILALKWRPKHFKDVVGQNHITETLQKAFEKNRIAQAFLFAGPRGVGKTTTARLLAMSLNGSDTPSIDYDADSDAVKEIIEGRSMDVVEIDGASNRGIDEIRELRENIKFMPLSGKFKVVIIDEVHMLTVQAFNALLKTLEEPPAHVKFIMATTDIHKVPQTIISRCQRFDFLPMTNTVIKDRLNHILEVESVEIDDTSLELKIHHLHHSSNNLKIYHMIDVQSLYLSPTSSHDFLLLPKCLSSSHKQYQYSLI